METGMACDHGWLFAIPCPRCATENAARAAAAPEVTAAVTKTADPPSNSAGLLRAPELKPNCDGCRPLPSGIDPLEVPGFLMRGPHGFVYPTPPSERRATLVDQRPDPALAKAEALAEHAAKQRELLDERRRVADHNKKMRAQGGTVPLTGKAAWEKIRAND